MKQRAISCHVCRSRLALFHPRLDLLALKEQKRLLTRSKNYLTREELAVLVVNHLTYHY